MPHRLCRQRRRGIVQNPDLPVSPCGLAVHGVFYVHLQCVLCVRACAGCCIACDPASSLSLSLSLGKTSFPIFVLLFAGKPITQPKNIVLYI